MTVPPNTNTPILPGDGLTINLFLTNHPHPLYADPAHPPPPMKPYDGKLLELAGTPVCELPAHERKSLPGSQALADEDLYGDGKYAARGVDAVGGFRDFVGRMEGQKSVGVGAEMAAEGSYRGKGGEAESERSFEGQLEVIEKLEDRTFEGQLVIADGLRGATRRK
jgi:hypothetical protein